MDAWSQFPLAEPSTGNDPWSAFPKAEPDIDFNRPVEQVRADVDQLSGQSRATALEKWADTYVRKEAKANPVGVGADDVGRSLASGSLPGLAANYLNAGTNALAYNASRFLADRFGTPTVGAPYDETLAYQRARDKSLRENSPVASTVGNVVGGIASGVGGLKAFHAGQSALRRGAGLVVGGPGAAVLPAGTVAGQMAQGAALGPVYGYAGGFASTPGGEGTLGDQVARRHEGGKTGAAWGLGLGLVAPPVINAAAYGASRAVDGLKTSAARYGTDARNLAERAGLMRPEAKPRALSAAAASTDGAPPVTGADAAADQLIANQLARANVNEFDLRGRIRNINDARRFHSKSFASDATALADLDPSLAKLAGSLKRQQPEADNIARNFITTRQTGVTPQSPLHDGAGLTHRPLMSRVRPDDGPAGQAERVLDALRRSMLIKDADYHGHSATGYSTQQSIISRAKTSANDLYGAAYKAAEGVEIRPNIFPVMQKWADIAVDEPAPVRAALTKAIRMFMTKDGEPVAGLQRFDKAKQFMDDVIDGYFKSPNGKQRYLGGRVNEFKKEMLKSIDDIQANGLGAAYSKARNEFSSQMELRDAYQIGRGLFKENSEIGIEQFRALATEGERKLARLGIYQAAADAAKTNPRGNDVTRLLSNPRIQEILEEMIPRDGRAAGSVFQNRPERFGEYLTTEQGYIRTRDAVLGGSPTAERLADDQATRGIMGLIEAMRSNQGLVGAGVQMVEHTLNRMFGVRADTAAIAARKLFSANPQERDRIIESIARRLGPNRTQQLLALMQEHNRMAVQGGAVAGGTAAGQ